MILPSTSHPPCPPQIEILGNCEDEINTLFWTNPNDSCSDDAVLYSLYFTPFLDSSFSLISNFNNINDTTFQHQHQYNNTNSVAGCYYITATDSAIYNNESFRAIPFVLITVRIIFFQIFLLLTKTIITISFK